MTKPIIVGYDSRRAGHAPLEFGVAAVEVGIDAVVGDPAGVLVDLSQSLGLLVCGSRGYGPVRACCSAACRAGS